MSSAAVIISLVLHRLFPVDYRSTTALEYEQEDPKMAAGMDTADGADSDVVKMPTVQTTKVSSNF
jgi:hypothetical protein